VRLAFHLTDARFSNTRSVSLLLKDVKLEFFVPKCEVRVSSQRRETRVFVPKREGRVSSAENELRVSNSKCEPLVSEPCVSELRHKTHIHSPTAKVITEPRSPHPQRFEADLFDPPATDLRDYLTKKMSVHQITPQCSCEQLIIAVLSECHCSFHASKQSVFNWLSAAPVSRSAKRRRSQRKRAFSDMEYPEVTANMVGPSTTPNRT